MDNKLLLVKSITLLYRESVGEYSDSNSSDLVNNLLNYIKVSDISLGINTEKEIIQGLKSTAKEMAANDPGYKYNRETLLQQLRLNTVNDDRLFEILKKAIEEEYNETNNKRAITNLIKDLNNFFVEEQIGEILSKAAFTFKTGREKIKDVNTYIAELVGQLEPLQTNVKLKDPAITASIDLGDTENINLLLKEAKSSGEESLIMRLGWQDLNKALQGGVRRGDFGMIGALQHKYKTGFTLSLFKQIAVYNKPYMLDPTKKPLLLRISFEDDLKDNIFFLYQQLKTDETSAPINMDLVDTEEATKYIRERMEINGYHVKFMRVDPTRWSYKNICNKVIELEAQGYEIHVLMLDYLAHVPTTGCINSGAQGTDLRDMFRRMRNFCSPRKIALITPHQLSSDAKSLSRGGIPDEQFVKEINEKGYYAGSKQLDQEVDWELYIHIAKENRRSYLTVQRGKHRIPSIIDDEDKYFMLPFPKKTPIPDDINGKNIGLKKYPDGSVSENEDSENESFGFGF